MARCGPEAGPLRARAPHRGQCRAGRAGGWRFCCARGRQQGPPHRRPAAVELVGGDARAGAAALRAAAPQAAPPAPQG
eukprot:11226502-Lingulodinium_polyedra.AAC.1